MLISRSTASRLHVAHPSSPSAKLGTLHSIITPFLCKPFKEILCCYNSGGFFFVLLQLSERMSEVTEPSNVLQSGRFDQSCAAIFVATSGHDPPVFSAQILTALNHFISVQAYISIHSCLEICMTKHTL